VLFFCYVLANCLEWSDSRFSFVIYHSTAWSGAYPKFIMYHPTPIDSTCFFFCYIIQLPTGVDRTQNLLYIIQRRIYHSTAYWSGAYPKFIRYHSTAYWSGAYPKFIILYHPTPIGATHAFHLLYINQLPTGVERTLNLLCIIQIRLTGRAFSFVISFNCLLEWSVPKIHYISSNAKYIIQLPTGGERTQNLLYIIQHRIYHSTAYWSGAYPKFIIYHPTPIGATRACVCYISINCLLKWSVP
jgi:hypothetical protein